MICRFINILALILAATLLVIIVSVSGLTVQALTSDESACPLNLNGDAREHRALNALRPVSELEFVLPCTRECL